MDPVNVFIVGPTASGKTGLAISLAERLDAEILSADSRQVYRDLDAGTAKPSLRDGRAGGIPYRLVGFLSPSEPCDAGSFARLAGVEAARIRARGKRVIVAGGTGLYVKALLEGLSPLPPRDPEVRRRLVQEAERDGRQTLHDRLKQVDPEAARAIPAGNIQRVARALELHELCGKPPSALWREAPRSGALPGKSLVLSIEWPAAELRARIEARARAMWPGLLAEARRLVPACYRGDEPGFQSLGYGEAVACARGGLPESEGLTRMIKATLAYAKRQRTWFRGQLKERAVIPGGPSAEMLETALRHVRP